ncbi:MAG: DNA primase [Paludisphaera borealis]|nr:DNA primase [Paludisphaera borealis]
MPRHSDTNKAAIKNAVDIVGLVGEYLQLRRAGSRYKGLCPFHDDRNPSMEVNPERQTFKCWSCGEGGDVFDFVQKIERVEFPEALRMLAERAGIVLESPSASAAARSGGPTKSDLAGVLAWAEKYFANGLKSSDAARAYLEERGLSAASVARHRLGFAPEERGRLSAEARKQGFTHDLLEQAGLIVRPEDSPGAVRERFRGRLIFPIHDERGRTIGFGGRILPEAERVASSMGNRVAKYLNSPETALFQKRRVLYAADLARTAGREAGWVAVVEGYTDVIAAHQVGLCNVVGTLGTAFGDDHVQTLRRLADRACLVFDGDTAGQTAAERALEVFLGHELDVRVLSLPSGLDPCDFLLNQGADAFRDLASKAVDPLAFILDRARVRFEFESIEGSRQAAEWILGIMSQVPSQSLQESKGLKVKMEKALDSLSRSLRVPIDPLKKRFNELHRAAAKPKSNRREPDGPPGSTPRIDSAHAVAAAPELFRAMDPVDRELLEIVVNQPDCVSRIVSRVPLVALRDDAARAILKASYDLFSEGERPCYESLVTRLEDPRPRALAAYLDHTGSGTHEEQPLDDDTASQGDWERRLELVLGRLAERERLVRLGDLRQALDEIDQQADPDAYRALELEYRRLLTQRAGTKKSRPDPTFRA